MEKITSQDGTRIAFSKTGKGPALVVVDGAFCFSTHGPSAKLASLLADHFTVYTYDRRGRGESTNVLPYAVEREIEDLAAVVESTDASPYLLGNSSGAALVLHALSKGMQVKKAALFEPPYVRDFTADSGPPKDAEAQLSNFVNLGKKSEAVAYFMSKIMGMPKLIVLLVKLFGKSMWKKNESVAHTLAYDIAILGDFAVPQHKAARITVPVIVIGGERSPQSMKSGIEATTRAIRGSQTVWLKGQSHNASMEALAPVLLDFFKE